nr:MAG TPA: hypothetical protein [Caudoviricetes sp.]
MLCKHKQKEMPQHLFFLAFACSFSSALKYIQCDECEGTYRQEIQFLELFDNTKIIVESRQNSSRFFSIFCNNISFCFLPIFLAYQIRLSVGYYSNDSIFLLS